MTHELCACGWSDEEHDFAEHSPVIRHIWTARDWDRAVVEATRRADKESLDMLWCHTPHTYHCGGYEVAAWPCVPAANVLNELLGGDQ